MITGSWNAGKAEETFTLPYNSFLHVEGAAHGVAAGDDLALRASAGGVAVALAARATTRISGNPLVLHYGPNDLAHVPPDGLRESDRPAPDVEERNPGGRQSIHRLHQHSQPDAADVPGRLETREVFRYQNMQRWFPEVVRESIAKDTLVTVTIEKLSRQGELCSQGRMHFRYDPDGYRYEVKTDAW